MGIASTLRTNFGTVDLAEVSPVNSIFSKTVDRVLASSGAYLTSPTRNHRVNSERRL